MRPETSSTWPASGSSALRAGRSPPPCPPRCVGRRPRARRRRLPSQAKSAAPCTPPVSAKACCARVERVRQRVEELGGEARRVVERRRAGERVLDRRLAAEAAAAAGVEVAPQRLEVDRDALAPAPPAPRCRPPRACARARRAAPRGSGRASRPRARSPGSRVASSSSWPGVRITTASDAPPSWISSGSSRATRSAPTSASPSVQRTRSTKAVASDGAFGRGMAPA